MKKILFLCSLIMLFILSGCNLDDQVNELESYDIEVTNFESFFNVSYRVIPGESDLLEVKIIPKEAYIEVSGKVYISVYTNYIFDGVAIKDVFEFDVDLKNELVAIDKALTLGERHQVFSLTIDDAYGNLTVDKKIDIVKKTYEKPFEIHILDIENMYENLRIY